MLKMYVKICISVQTIFTGNSNSVRVVGIVVESKGFVHIFNLFLVLELK